jgi:formylglycine-generating enzyme required for sulfatase activity
MISSVRSLFVGLYIAAALAVTGATSVGVAQDTAKKNPGELTNSISMRFALIPAGEFQMGSPRNEPERIAEEARHPVTISRPFYLGVYEVTQEEFQKVMGTETRAVFDGKNGGGPQHPMDNLQWTDAKAFCQKLSDTPQERSAGRSYRLPTEAEWEYACRAGTTSPFYFGDSLSSAQANFNGNYPYQAEPGKYLRRTTPVGSYPPNAFGLYDMHGNVAEWCADWYDPDYYQNSPDQDPLGPPVGVLSDDFENYYLVARGGSWLDDGRACRAAHRQRAMHRNRYWWIGFRVVCDVQATQ